MSSFAGQVIIHNPHNPMTTYLKRYDLHQHSPMLHFQHEQAGATLRASEVKPKFDQFLIDKLGGEQTVAAEYAHWLVSEGKAGHVAFDYRLRIWANGKPQKSPFVIIPDSDEANHDVGVLYSKGLVMEFFSLHEELMEWVDMVLEEFLIRHNFGKRGSKAFGSFTLAATTKAKAEEILRNETRAAYRRNGSNSRDFDQNYYDRVIAKDNQLLKSGFNHNGYKKSELFHYASSQGLRWDKRHIKREINSKGARRFREVLYAKNYDPIDINQQNTWEDNTPEEYRFFRAMLGLPELYEFLVDNNGRPGSNKYIVKIDQEEIKRFRSPITFKYLFGHLYVVAEHLPDGIFGKSFTLHLQTKRDRDAIPLDDIKTPTREEFNLVEFLNHHLPSLSYQPL